MEIRSPLVIIIELLGSLIVNTIESFVTIYVKLLELFVTLGYISGLSPLGFILALFIGSLVIYFIIKYVFGSSKTLVFVFLFYFALLVLLGISLVFV
ncbi:MAG: hypothetical protein JW700_02420 [Candidatus Aenigmarchaeota archaeon]|nr:hypothetical protein [Candidatus Aenigmarchaeota archaeon]